MIAARLPKPPDRHIISTTSYIEWQNMDMRYHEITEYQEIPDIQNPKFPPIESLTKMTNQSINVAGRNYDLYGSQTTDNFVIVLIFNETVISYIQAFSAGEYFQVKNAFVTPEYIGKGIMTNLFNWCSQNSIPIISDTQMTKAGGGVWKNLQKFGLVKIVDLKTNKKYEIDKSPVKPEMDNSSPNVYDSASGDGQRFFYIIECWRSKNTLMENMTSEWRPNTIQMFVNGD